MKRKLALLVVLIMTFSMFISTLAVAENKDVSTSLAAPTPTKAYDAPGGNAGDWYVGAQNRIDYTKPVVVFVHGSGDRAQVWWDDTVYYGKNNMYELAYNAGYRTAFVNLKDSDASYWSRPNCSNFVNGSILANQLAQICQYYRVSKVNIVAHSKGGVDTNTAIAYYNANNYVNNVVTLASPHWGSHLADIATSWVLRPIMIALGQYTGSTDSLKTSYLRYFRAQTDNRTSDRSVSYFTFAGTSKGKTGSALAAAGAILYVASGFQSNDGLVPLNNAYKPYARHISTRAFDHDQIRVGSSFWYLINPIVANNYRTYITEPEENLTKQEFMPVTANSIYRGDSFIGAVEAVIPVDSSVSAANFDVITSDKNVKVTLIQPDGKEYIQDGYKLASEGDDIVFKGAAHNTFEIVSPMKGKWTIKLDSDEKAAYAVITTLDSKNSFTIAQENIVFKETEVVPFTVDMTSLTAFGASINEATVNVSEYSRLDENVSMTTVNLIKEKNMLKTNEDMKFDPGMYDVDITIKGVNADGSEFERTAIYSIIVEPENCEPQDFMESIMK